MRYVLEPLGGDSLTSYGTDPIAGYGQRAAAIVLSSLRRVPAGQRTAALRALLAPIDPTLADRVLAAPRLGPALAAEMQRGLLDELAFIGRTGRFRGGPSPLALAADPVGSQVRALCELGWNPLSTITKGMGWVTNKLGGAGGAAAGAVKAGVKKLGELACSVTSMPGAQQAAATYNPAAGGGVAVASNLCAKGQTPAPLPPQPQQPAWLVPVLVAGGVVLVVLAVR